MTLALPLMAESSTPRPAASPSVAMMGRMVKASLALAHVGWLVAIFAGHLLAGPLGVVNAALGGGLVVFFYAAGQGMQMFASELEPQAGMGLIVASFMTRAALLGLLLVGANAHPSLEESFRPVAFGLGVGLALVGWLGGMFWSWSRTRVPVYDQHWDPRPTPARRGRHRGRDADRRRGPDPGRSSR